MIYKKFSLKLIVRLILILLNMAVIAIIFGDSRLFFNQIILGSVLIFQVFEILKFIQKTNRELARFFMAIKQSDFSVAFTEADKGSSLGELYHSFEEIIDAYKKVKIEREAQFLFLKHLVDQLPVGIISTEENNRISLLNRPAKNTLGLSEYESWSQLTSKLPAFVERVENIGNAGKSLLELEIKGRPKTLSIELASIKIMGENHRVITIQDIRNQIEQKEIEAWNKLIRILTHEIMNSITPISSLTETMQMVLEKDRKPINFTQLNQQILNDLLFSIKTIQKRSSGMLDFVDDYRRLTRIPTPKIEKVLIKPFLERVVKLMEAELNSNHVELRLETDEVNSFNLDPNLVEQVIINLITNAISVLNNQSKKLIVVSSEINAGWSFIKISDNGPGIDPRHKDEIFIPFFSTKEEGSGIGLSLSKQIMHLHGGYIKFESKSETGTIFSLEFRNSES